MKSFKKFFNLILSFVLSIFILSNFAGCVRGSERKLAKIPTDGNYIFRSGLFLNQGNTVVNIKDEIRKQVSREKFVFCDDESYCETAYAEKDGVIYFIICYNEKNKTFVNESPYGFDSDNYFAFGSTPVLDVDVTISDYFMIRGLILIKSCGIFGKRVVFEVEDRRTRNVDFLVYDCETLQRIDFDAEDFEYDMEFENNFVLSKVENGVKYYRVYDGDLKFYEYSRTADSLSERIYGDYLLFYNREQLEETLQVVRYKTGDALDSPEALAIYDEIKPSGINYDFEHDGKKYVYEINEISEKIPTGEFDKNGEEIFNSKKYDEIVFTDMETNEEYTTTSLKLHECASEMKKIQEIYGVTFNGLRVFSMNGELYFEFWNDDTFFGVATPDTTPDMVFRYNGENRDFEYLGFAYRSFTHIYEGFLKK